MKKTLYLTFLFALTLPVIANAATFSFSPSAGSFSPGDTFSVAIFVNPDAGEEITVAKLLAQFPADILEVISFSQTAGWMSPTSGEFDSLDNTVGTFEKMAGYPARVTVPTQFGTVTLKAKTAGTATIGAGDGSMILDTTNADKYIVSSGATFVITTPVLEPVERGKEKVVEKQMPVVKEVLVEENTQDETIEVPVEEESIASSLDLATVAKASEGFFTTKNVIFSVIFIILAVLGFTFTRKKENRFN